MAEPLRKFEDEPAGNVDSAAPGRPELKALEGGGETSEPNRSWYKGDKKGVERDELSEQEDSAASQNESTQGEDATHENQVGRGYQPSYKSSVKNTKMDKQEKRDARKWLFKNRRAVMGGGVVGTLIALFSFFFFQGPLQFVHIAQLMEQFHFASQEEQADDRFTKLARYIKYRGSGEIEKTRLGFYQNKIADRVEGKMNKVGIKSSYTDVFGFGDGYIIDADKLSRSEFDDLKGKSNAESAKYLKDNFSVEIKTKLPNGSPLPKGSFFVDASDLGYFQNRKLVKTMLKVSLYNKIASSVGARVMGKRAGVNWHPMKRLDNKILKTAEARYLEWKKQRVSDVQNGNQVGLEGRASYGEDSEQAVKDEANKAAAEGNAVVAEGKDTGTKVSAGDTEAIAAFQDSLSAKIGLGGASAAGVLCMVRGIDQNADQIKMKQVVLPLIRLGMLAVTFGNQVMFGGSDSSTEQLGFLSKQLNGKDSTKHKSSWIQAESIQAELGHSKSGVKPDETLTTITNNTPFHFLTVGVFDAILTPVCSVPGQLAITIVSFFGGPVSALTQTVVGEIVGGHIMNTIAHWLAGSAVDPLPVGADFGNEVNFGSLLAANAQGVSRGGRELSKDEAKKLAEIERSRFQKEFNNKSLAYKIFNLNDPRSAAAKVIDQASPSIDQNISNVANSLLHFGQMFSSVPKLLTANVHADDPIYYDYGVPRVGFSVAEINSPFVKNPYLNACRVIGCTGVVDENGNTVNITGILQGPNGEDYIERAKTCFGVTIDPATFDITDFQAGNPEYKDITSDDCKSTDSDWMKIRFYIFDTQNMLSIACYEGEEDACQAVGAFSQESTQDDTGTATTDCSVTAPVYGSQKGSGNEYSQQQLAQIFGNPGTASSHPAMDKNLTSVDFNGHNVSINKKASGCLEAVAQEIKDKGIKYEIKEMGCYRFDSNNGGSNIGLSSYHTYGVACDINWSTNPWSGSGAAMPYDMPEEYIKIFHNHGFTWGGNWVSVKDYMHFEFNGIKP
jgi:hypothetical protein